MFIRLCLGVTLQIHCNFLVCYWPYSSGIRLVVNLGLECKMRTLSGVLEPAAFWSVVCKELLKKNWSREKRGVNAFTRVITNGHDCDCLKPQGKQNCDVWRGGGARRHRQKIFNFEGMQIVEVSLKNLNLINAAVYALDRDGRTEKEYFSSVQNYPQVYFSHNVLKNMKFFSLRK